MKINNATVLLDAAHTYVNESAIEVATVTSFKSLFDGLVAIPARSAASDVKNDDAVTLVVMLKSLISRLLELLAGQLRNDHDALPTVWEQQTGLGEARSGHTLEMSREVTTRVTRHEAEQTDFSARGQVRTSDGRCIGFDLGLCMARDYVSSETSIQKDSVVLRDPLIINFAGNAAELCGRRISFDLDGDGKDESIDRLGGGSGYLAIDRNADGVINDGSDLFGATSGDGFAELEKLDSDANHWLDENDPLYATLRVWRPDIEGKNALQTLADTKVGAIYLGQVSTPFALNDADDQMRGMVRSSGVYLNEGGSAGTIQQVDLAV